MQKQIKLITLASITFVFAFFYFAVLPKLNSVSAQCQCANWCISSYTCEDPGNPGHAGWCSDAYCCDPVNTCNVSCDPGYYPCNRPGNCCPVGTPPPTPPGGGGGGGPSCTFVSWSPAACGAGGCASNQRLYNAIYNPAGCNSATQCVTDTSCGCSNVCGNGTCEACESTANCTQDCGCAGPTCNNNGVCGACESPSSCPGDCGCSGSSCNNNGTCEACETTTSCPGDCTGGCTGSTCNNNGVCGPCETQSSCPGDCTSCSNVCGNGTCEPCESTSNCSTDCTPTCTNVCGNDICEACESSTNCSVDCSPSCTNVCGNGTCEPCETNTSCPSDCTASCTNVCGNGICEACENQTNCSNDCLFVGASCSITIPGANPLEFFPGTTASILPTVNEDPGSVGATVNQITFTLSSAANFGVCNSSNSSCTIGSASYTDSSAGYSAKVTAGLAPNTSATLTVSGQMTNGTVCTPDSIIVSVINPPPWAQVKSGDLITKGSVDSPIPVSCTGLPVCDPALITYNTTSAGESPGVVDAGSGIAGSVQSSNPQNYTVTGDPYAGSPIDYNYFLTKGGSLASSISSVTTSTLTTGAPPDAKGYRWRRIGATTINGNITLGSNKVVLFVNGNLTINGKINLTKGLGFFMVIVQGDINVNEAIGGAADATPDLEGVYFAEGSFISDYPDTIDPDQQLHLRGAVAADDIDLARSLVNNSQTPAEFFEFGADQVMRIPTELSRKQVVWREVAP